MSKDKIAESIEGVYVTISMAIVEYNRIINKIAKILNLPADKVAIAFRHISPLHENTSWPPEEELQNDQNINTDKIIIDQEASSPLEEESHKMTHLCKAGTEFLKQLMVLVEELKTVAKGWDEEQKENWKSKILTNHEDYLQKNASHSMEPVHLLGGQAFQNPIYNNEDTEVILDTI